MKYFVRTTGERDLSSFSRLEYEALYDKEHQPVKSLIEQFKKINNCNALLMEDDIILCEDFENKVQEVIKRFPNQIINFFYQPFQYQITGVKSGRSFLYNQCVYYPRGNTKKIALEMEKLLEEGFKFDQYDRLQAKAMSNLGLDFVSFRPMLVQHVGHKSLLNNKWPCKGQTFYFIDDLKRLNLNYDDCKAMLDYTYSQMDKNKIGYIKPKIIKK